MTIEGAFLARATAVGGITLHGGRAPQGAVAPYTVFTRVGQEYEHASGADETTKHALYQFTSFAETYAEAHDVDDQVQAAFSRWSGTADSTTVEQIFAEDNGEIDQDETTRLFGVRTDFMVHYR